MPITLDTFRRFFHFTRDAAVPDPAAAAMSQMIPPAVVSQSANPAQTARALKTAGRPISPSLSKAIELLRNDPNVTANDLADAAGVSKDYARILLKRAKARVPARSQSRSPAGIHSVESPAVSAGRQPWRDSVEELRLSLDRTQAQVAELTAAPRLRTALNSNRRAAVLRLHQTGRPVTEIAAELGINPGEVEFIVKVNRLITEHF